MIKAIALCIGVLLTGVMLEGLGRAVYPSPQHAHRYSDIRFRLVEVLKVEGGRLATTDLEEQTVGPDLVYEMDQEFAGVLVVEDRLEVIKKEELKGKKGVLSYCEFCHHALNLVVRKEIK